MKKKLIYFILIPLLMSHMTLAQSFSSPTASFKQPEKPKMTECYFCDVDNVKTLIGSNNSNRKITPLSVVGKPVIEGLPTLFEPPALIDIPVQYSTPLYQEDYIKTGLYEKMHRPAFNDLKKLLDAARSLEIDLYVHSAYRSYENQCKVFTRKLKKEIETKKMSLPAAIVSVNSRSALPGQSEHQLGTSVDLVTFLPQYETSDKPKYSGYAVEYEMQNTPAFKWLQANAYRYGFVMSYPLVPNFTLNAVNPRTGYIFEPWHWRWIGAKHATLFKRCGNLVLREYLQKLAINPHFQCITSYK